MMIPYLANKLSGVLETFDFQVQHICSDILNLCIQSKLMRYSIVQRYREKSWEIGVNGLCLITCTIIGTICVDG